MTIPESPSTRDLRSLFCERFNCPASEFEKRALRECLYLHARIIAPLLRCALPNKSRLCESLVRDPCDGDLTGLIES